jgi:RNA polymerase sigma-70 factor (sigma-E family)
VADKDAEFKDFFETEFRPLRRLGYLLTGDWGEAEDLAQEAMVRTYRAWSSIRERERPGAYARSVLVNRRRSLLRRSMVAQRHAETMRSEAYAPDLGEESMMLWDAIRALPRRQRAALVLRFYEDLPEAEIARILEAPVGTVKSLVHRGLAGVRDRLGNQWPGMETTDGGSSS